MSVSHLFIHPKFNGVYAGVIAQDIQGTIGNSPFKKGEEVRVAIGMTERILNEKISARLRAWRSDAGGMSVMCEDIQGETADVFKAEILADVNEYNVFCLAAKGKDIQFAFSEAKQAVNLKWRIPAGDPYKIVSSVIDGHNNRVF